MGSGNNKCIGLLQYDWPTKTGLSQNTLNDFFRNLSPPPLYESQKYSLPIHLKYYESLTENQYFFS
jgi:hypothetical protein